MKCQTKSGLLWKKVLAITLAVLFFAAFTAVASAATIYVPDNFSTIQQAVDNATAGDTIIVRDGAYTENVNLNKQLTIRSENGSASTTVQAANSDDHVFEVTADYVNISGFTVTGTVSSNSAGIYLGYHDHCSISNNNASNNFCGIFLYSSSNNTLTSNTANSNNGYGIFLDSSSNNTLTSNIANSSHFYDGICLNSSSNNTLTSNIANSNGNAGIRLLSSSNNTLTSNIANSNDCSGIFLLSSSYNNTLTGNILNSNGCAGIDMDSSSYNTLTGNTANSNSYGGFNLEHSSNYNTLTGNTANENKNLGGIYLASSSDNLIYNNYFNNTLFNAYDIRNNVWNITKTLGTNIIGGQYLGGNYWSDYAGRDITGDGLGDTFLPYNSNGNIIAGGDYHPLCPEALVISIKKLDNPDPVLAGGTLNYSISVNNTGNATATNVTVTETYDENVAFVSAVPAPSQGNETWVFSTLNASETDWINVSVTVNASTANGTVLHNIVNVSSNEGVTDYDVENTTVFSDAVHITSFAPPSPVSDVVCNWRTFKVTVDQTVNVSWYLNGSLLFTNESVRDASCRLHADAVGVHNVSAIASNANGADMQTWKWKVIVGLNCTCGNICVNETGWWRDGGAFNPSSTPIQDAIDNTTAGETICVKDGTYNENVDVNKSLTIRSKNGSASTTVQASNPDDHVFEVTADYVNISGFTVTGATGSEMSGIYFYAANHSNISNNTASNNCYGIFLSYLSNNKIINNNALDNLYGIILVESSNNMLENNTASNGQIGIYLAYSSNNEIMNNTANSNDYYGIYLGESSNNEIMNNNALDNLYGIILGESSNNEIMNNNALDNLYGIVLGSSSNNMLENNTASNDQFGIYMSRSSNNEIMNNTANSNDYYGIYLSGSSNNTLENNTAKLNDECGIMSDSSNNNTFTKNNAMENWYGIYLDSSNNNTLEKNNAMENWYGAYLDSSNNNTLEKNNAMGNGYGIYLKHSSYNMLRWINAVDNDYGIYLDSSSYNTIYSTENTNRWYGIYLVSSSFNTLEENNLLDNRNGIHLENSYDNLIYNNYFNNTNNARDDGSNIWNITKEAGTNIIGGPYLGGNYWSDYAGMDTDGDGLGDTLLPYNSSGEIRNGGDYHPLVLQPGISVTKVGNVTEGVPSTNVNYTISVTNTGSCNLIVTAVDTLPANMSYVGSSPEADAHDDTIRWNIGTVAANDSTTVYLVAYIEEGASGVLNNTVHVEGKPEHGDNVTSDAYYEIAALVPPNITSFAPPSPVNDTVCNWRTFNVSVDQTVNVSWYLTGSLLFTNESVRDACCRLHADAAGVHNVSAIASNANGTDMQTWIWNVTKAADLVITEKWLCWPDNCTICYNVTNIGNGTAPACHNTSLYVDGLEVAYDHVPVNLAPNASYIGCFGDYSWQYTPPSANITVCADNNETIDELDENNNCLTNIWRCGDVNCDGKVTMSDVRKVFNRYLDPNYPLDLPWAADVNCDGKVTMSDVRKVFNHYFDPSYELNCCCELL